MFLETRRTGVWTGVATAAAASWCITAGSLNLRTSQPSSSEAAGLIRCEGVGFAGHVFLAVRSRQAGKLRQDHLRHFVVQHKFKLQIFADGVQFRLSLLLMCFFLRCV